MPLRKCSGVIIYRYNKQHKEFEVLLIKTRNFENLYTIPGGRLEPEDKGENIIEKAENCAIRESYEEVRLGIRNVQYLGMKKATGKDINYKDPETDFEFHDFVAQVEGELNIEEIINANDEVTYAGFHRERELVELLIEPRLKAQIQQCYTENFFRK